MLRQLVPDILVKNIGGSIEWFFRYNPPKKTPIDFRGRTLSLNNSETINRIVTKFDSLIHLNMGCREVKGQGHERSRDPTIAQNGKRLSSLFAQLLNLILIKLPRMMPGMFRHFGMKLWGSFEWFFCYNPPKRPPSISRSNFEP
jgi:hypothetical protein